MAKKVDAWLIWNGVYSLQGQCNAQGFKQPAAAKPNRIAVQVGRPGNPAPPPVELVADDAISVRLSEVRTWGEAGNEFLLIHTRLKRVVGIQSLLLLIYRNYDPQNPKLSKDTLVYQEVLTAAQIQRLADSDPTSSPDWERIAQPATAAEAKKAQPNQAAHAEHTPYKVRVWVSKDANAFAGFDGSTLPKEVYGITVHDQTESWKKRGGKYLDPKLDDKPDEVDAAEWQRLIAKWQRLALDEPGRNLALLSFVTLVLEDETGKPYADVRYEVWIDGKQYSIGQNYSSAEGLIRAEVPPVKEVELRVWFDEESEPDIYMLKMDTLDPLDTIAGVQDRLNNLGYDCGDEQGEIGPLTTAALMLFQAETGIEPADGTLNETTRQKLLELHGS